MTQHTLYLNPAEVGTLIHQTYEREFRAVIRQHKRHWVRWYFGDRRWQDIAFKDAAVQAQRAVTFALRQHAKANRQLETYVQGVGDPSTDPATFGEPDVLEPSK